MMNVEVAITVNGLPLKETRTEVTEDRTVKTYVPSENNQVSIPIITLPACTQWYVGFQPFAIAINNASNGLFAARIHVDGHRAKGLFLKPGMVRMSEGVNITPTSIRPFCFMKLELPGMISFGCLQHWTYYELDNDGILMEMHSSEILNTLGSIQVTLCRVQRNIQDNTPHFLDSKEEPYARFIFRYGPLCKYMFFKPPLSTDIAIQLS